MQENMKSSVRLILCLSVGNYKKDTSINKTKGKEWTLSLIQLFGKSIKIYYLDWLAQGWQVYDKAPPGTFDYPMIT